MSMIVRMIESMDGLLEAHSHPHHFLLDEAEWAEVRARFEEEDAGADIVDGDTYRGVPVQFGRHEKAGTVALLSLNQLTVSE